MLILTYAAHNTSRGATGINQCAGLVAGEEIAFCAEALKHNITEVVAGSNTGGQDTGMRKDAATEQMT